MFLRKILPLCLFGAFAPGALADNAPQGGRPPGPPPIDTAACKGKAAGAAVQVTTPDGRALTGTCQLAFVPDFKDGAPPAPPAASK
ncbi:hypothetical protein [Chitinimonas naiadis]